MKKGKMELFRGLTKWGSQIESVIPENTSSIRRGEELERRRKDSAS